MFILDTHLHATPTKRPAHIPLGDYEDSITENVDAHLQAMDAAGVDAALVVQWNSRNGADPSYEAGAAERHPGRYMAAYAPDPGAPDAVAKLRGWLQRGVKGVRLFNQYASANRSDNFRIDAPECAAMIECAAEFGVPVMIMSPAAGLAAVTDVFARYPNVTFILDHIGVAKRIEDIADYARHENLELKFSSGGLIDNWKGPDVVNDQRRLFREIVSAYGVGRLMWGSNYPQTRVALPVIVQRALQVLDFLPSDDLAKVMGGNALRHWKFKEPVG